MRWMAQNIASCGPILNMTETPSDGRADGQRRRAEKLEQPTRGLDPQPFSYQRCLFRGARTPNLVEITDWEEARKKTPLKGDRQQKTWSSRPDFSPDKLGSLIQKKVEIENTSPAEVQL